MSALHKATWSFLVFFCLQLTSCAAHRAEKVSYPIIRPINSPTIVIAQPPKPIPEVMAPLRQMPKNGKLVVVDPGHGGKDLGAHSNKSSKYQEKVLTLSISRILKGYLEQLGYTVEMTRNTDVFVDLYDRAEFANEREPAAFVSIHFNSAPNAEAKGIEIFYYKSEKDKQRMFSSKALAKNILNRMIACSEAKSRGVKHKDLAVIRETNMPAVLVEGGFLTNSEEVVKLKDASYLKLLAWGIAQGVDAYLQQ